MSNNEASAVADRCVAPCSRSRDGQVLFAALKNATPDLQIQLDLPEPQGLPRVHRWYECLAEQPIPWARADSLFHAGR